VARQRWPDGLTSRQEHVLTLIARGQTNKEIAHELAITERGVAAHVSRLLRTYDAPNRAGLVATALSVSYTPESLSPHISRPTAEALDLSAFDDSHFLVTVTFGRDQVIAYQNKSTRKLLLSMSSASMLNPPGQARFPRETAQGLRGYADDAFTRKTTVVVDNATLRWRNDNGTWVGGVFDWVLQPLFGLGDTIEGILWIGVAAALSVSTNSV
jgi:DNA-binding CsgD family transcriptional regulator